MYFETDDDEFAFDVEKEWTVDWARVADEEVRGYQWTGIENETWAQAHGLPRRADRRLPGG